VDAVTSAFVPGIGQHGHGLQERPQHAQDVLAGGGQVVDIAGKHIRNPQRYPGRVKQGLDVPAEIMGFPEYHKSMVLPLRLIVFSRHRSVVSTKPVGVQRPLHLSLPPLADECPEWTWYEESWMP